MHINTYGIHYYYTNRSTARRSFFVFTGSSSRCTQAPPNLHGLFAHFFAFSMRPSSQKKFTTVRCSASPRTKSFQPLYGVFGITRRKGVRSMLLNHIASSIAPLGLMMPS